MDYAAIAIVSALIGAWAGSRLNFGFQQKLLKQQLDFQDQSQKQLHSFIQSLHDTFIQSVRQMDNHLSAIARRLPGGEAYNAVKAAEDRPAEEHKAKDELP